MKTRPWPIVILAFAHVFAPLGNVFYSAWLMHRPVYLYFIYMFSHGHWHQNAAHFIGSPIAGIAIYKMNKWSYPIFLMAMLWILSSNFMTWREFPQYFGLSSLVLTFLLNVGIVSYFLIPEVRNVYFDPRLRWWETKPRYDVSFPVKIGSCEAQNKGVIQNISEGGIFISSEMILFADCEIDLNFDAFGKTYALQAKVAHARRAEPPGYGCQFLHSPESRAVIKNLVAQVKASGARERMGNVKLWAEFKSWFGTVLRTGKGLVP